MQLCLLSTGSACNTLFVGGFEVQLCLEIKIEGLGRLDIRGVDLPNSGHLDWVRACTGIEDF
jgi:hypothetical protein